MSACSAFRMGSGLVDVYTVSENLEILKTMLPEAIYHNRSADSDFVRLSQLMEQADCVVLGPGLSVNENANKLVSYVLEHCNKKLIIDADAINCIAQNPVLLYNHTSKCKEKVVLTPHPKELSRFLSVPVSEILKDYAGISVKTAKEYGIILMNSARIVSEFAALLGKTEDAAKYAELAANIRTAVMDTFFTPAGRLSVDTQAAYITALKFGLWRDKDVLIQQFLRRMRFDGFEIRCGFAGAPLMCSVLAEHGLDDLACELLLHRGFPGWMYCVELGVTTVWERWNSLLPDGMCSGTGMNSFNHYAYGSVMEYVYGYVAGIRPSKTGFRHATIAPLPNIHLGHVACSLETVSGKYVSNWTIAENGDVTIHIEVPFGCSAEVTLPRSGKAPFTVESGCYDYTYTPTEDYRALYSMDSRLAALADDEEAKQILLQETPALFGILMENNREFTTQTFHELSTAFFLGLNPPKIQSLMARLSALRYRPDQQ